MLGRRLLAVFTVLWATAVSHAYVLMPDSGQGFYWDPGDLAIEFKFGPSPALLDGSSWNESAQAALDEWNREMTAVRFVGVPTNETVGGQNNGKNEAFFAATAYGMTLGPGVAAITVLTSDGYPERNREADVIFNTAFQWDSYRGVQRTANNAPLVDFRRVALHEFGHILGLNHPDAAGATGVEAIMNASTADLDRLAPDDIAGVRFVYGPGAAPSFIEQPALRAVPGLSSDLTVLSQLAGTPPFTYEIFRDNQLVRTMHQSRGLLHDWAYVNLQFNTVADFGTYRIDAINRVGRATGKTYSFQPDPTSAAPSFTLEPQSLALARGEPGSLRVLVAGRPAATLRWFKDGVELPEETSAVLSLGGVPDEVGAYEVWAENPAGVTKSKTAHVTLLSLSNSTPGWSTLSPAMPPMTPTAMAYGNGMFVVVGYSGTVLTSSDGLQWTRRNLGSTVRLDTIIYAAGRFVAAGSADRATANTSTFVSFDGVGWARGEIAKPSGDLPIYVQKLAYGGGLFLATDLYGRVVRSTDGIQWEVGPRLTSGYLNTIAFLNGAFIVTGRNEKTWMSTDGLSWTEHSSGISVGMRSIAYGNGVYVGVGVPDNSPFDKVTVATSSNGMQWSSRIVQSLQTGAPEVKFINGRFHLSDGSSYLVSADGADWEQRNFTARGAPILAYGAGTYCAMGYFGDCYTSQDGLAWTASGKESAVRFASVAFTNGRFLTFDNAQFSVDGVSWQQTSVPGFDYQAAAFGGETWVAVGPTVIRSSDGSNWTTAWADPQTNFASVAYGAGKFVAVGIHNWTAQGGIAYSVDGGAWTELSPPGAGRLRGVAHGTPGFVAVGAGGTLLHSADGVAWQTCDAGTTKELHAVTWTGTRYVAVGGDGYGSITVLEPGTPLRPNATIATSSDGVNWHSNILQKEEVLTAVASLDGLIVAGGTDGVTVYSRDSGVTWSDGPSAPNPIWRLAAGHGRFYATSASNPSNLLHIPTTSFTPNPQFVLPPQLSSSDDKTTVSLHMAGAVPTGVRWFHDASEVATSSGPTWRSAPPQPPAVYFAELQGGGSQRLPVVIAPVSTAPVIGDARLVGADLVHQNGNVYDQFLLTGAAATIRAGAGKIARISFRDLSEDIVQVEFSGAGALTIVLKEPSGPGPAINYNQSSVDYMKGHADIFITGADESSHVSVFSVGRRTAINQTLFKSEINYDGVADISLLAIHSHNGRFGGARLGNAEVWSRTGVTGLWAPDTRFAGPLVVGNIAGYDSAMAGFVFRSAESVRISGGDLDQPNGRGIAVDGTLVFTFGDGTTSHDIPQPAQVNRARFLRNDIDVTTLIAPIR